MTEVSEPARPDLPPAQEIPIANLVKEGRTTKEIADLFRISERTVDCHRKNIRKKLNIVDMRVNLRTHLLNLK